MLVYTSSQHLQTRTCNYNYAWVVVYADAITYGHPTDAWAQASKLYASYANPLQLWQPGSAKKSKDANLGIFAGSRKRWSAILTRRSRVSNWCSFPRYTPNSIRGRRWLWSQGPGAWKRPQWNGWPAGMSLRNLKPGLRCI